jgi:hypothetical protein
MIVIETIGQQRDILPFSEPPLLLDPTQLTDFHSQADFFSHFFRCNSVPLQMQESV